MKVFSNLASTLDGRIARAVAPSEALGTVFDRRMMQLLRAQCDVVIFGATTLKVMKHAARIKNISVKSQPANAVLTRSGLLPASLPFWKESDIKRFVFTCDSGYRNAVKSSQGRAFVVSVGKTDVEPVLVLKFLKKQGFSKVLVEGGGRIFWSFVNSRCLNEVNLTLVPKIMGGAKNPLLVEGGDFIPIKKLKLKKVLKKGDELYLRYDVLSARKDY